jgi:hypothetical protein
VFAAAVFVPKFPPLPPMPSDDDDEYQTVVSLESQTHPIQHSGLSQLADNLGSQEFGFGHGPESPDHSCMSAFLRCPLICVSDVRYLVGGALGDGLPDDTEFSIVNSLDDLIGVDPDAGQDSDSEEHDYACASDHEQYLYDTELY